MWEKKKKEVSEEKFSKCEEGKKCKCRVSGVRKKNRNWKKSSEEKKVKVFWMEILLSSCSLVGLCINLQVKVAFKKEWKFSKCFFFWVGVLKLRLRFAKKNKVGWASCWLKSSITWANWKKLKWKNVWVVGYPVSWAPCCEQTKSWVPCCE